MRVARPRARSIAVLLAMVVVTLAAAITPPSARASSAPSWYYQEGGTVGSSFSFVTPLDPLLTVASSSDGGQSLAFQVTDAAVAGLAPTDQVTASATTSQLDLPMAQGPDTPKDLLTFGGDLETVRGVSVAFYYNIDGRSSDGDLQWTLAGNGGPGSFTLYVPAYTGGHTVAYKVVFTAPAAAMAAPVVLDDVIIGYGPYVKPPPAKKGDGTGSAPKKHKTGSDKGKSDTNTGRGSGSGAGSGSAAGNGSGTGGSGGNGSSGTRSTSANASVGSTPSTPTVRTSTAVRPARAVTDAPVSSPATGGSAVVQGYAVVASAALSAGEATVVNGAAGSGGGRSVGGGAGPGFSDTFLVGGAIVVGLLLLPIPFVARRLKRVAGYDHVAAAGGWCGDAVR